MTLTIIGLGRSMIVFAEESNPQILNLESLNKNPSKKELQVNLARLVHVRSLAASCAACHGTNGNSSANAAKLAGIDKSYFVTQMQAFQSGERVATVMRHNAKGLNSQEIADLAEYFSVQIPHSPVALPTQHLASQKLSGKYAD